MPQVEAWHSKKAESKVYHDNSKCHLGNNIETDNRLPGIGNKQKRCNVCEKLKKAKK